MEKWEIAFILEGMVQPDGNPAYEKQMKIWCMPAETKTDFSIPLG